MLIKLFKNTKRINLMKYIIFASGNGSNFEEFVQATKSGVLQGEVVGLVVNKPNAYVVERAQQHNINVLEKVWNKNELSREQYDLELVDDISKLDYDMGVCLGWSHILTGNFINGFNKPLYNLHPALPNDIVGWNSIKKAWEEYKQNTRTKSGIMFHELVEEVDRGRVMSSLEVPILSEDTFESFDTRMRKLEKTVMLNGMLKVLSEQTNSKNELVYTGKVREVYELGYDLLAMKATDRLSSFDRHITNIDNKGLVLNKLSEWWFNKTKHIVDNHLVWSYGDVSIVKKTRPIKLEMVVRNYMAGSTKTSLWTRYERGEREYCGIKFREGYCKHEKLDEPIVTPTTKGEIEDVPVSYNEILEMGIVSKKELDFLYQKSMELFRYGTYLAEQQNLILVDTKYEFGYDVNGNIILIDEVHTCDSSRYWVKDKYDESPLWKKDIVSLDKDVIRKYIKSKCDPYNDELPNIPEELREHTSSVYTNFYTQLTEEELDYNKVELDKMVDTYFELVHKNLVVVLAGSQTDKPWVEKIVTNLGYSVYSKVHYCSAHKNPKELMRLLDFYNGSENRNIIYITVAGMSNALSGVVAANTKNLVLAVPPFKDKMDMLVNVQSSLQCPSNVPVCTILNPKNVGLVIRRYFSK